MTIKDKSIIRKAKVYSISLLIISFLVCGLFSSEGFCQAKPGDENPTDKIVARVNEKPIAESDLAEEVNTYLKKFRKYGMKQVTPEALKTFKQRALNKKIDDEVLSQAIQKHKVPDLDQKAQKELASQKKSYKTEEGFATYLRANSLTEEELLASLKYKMQVNAYLESQGILHFEPTEEEIRAFYEQNKENYQKKERVKVRHILIQVEDGASSAEKEAARHKAEDVLKKIQSGQDFAKLAEEYSDCLRSNKNGGELGFIEPGFMPPEFDKIAFSIENSKTSDVVETRFGYHIVQVLEKEPAGYLSLDDVRAFIKIYLEQEHVTQLRLEHIKRLRQQAKIEIFMN